MSKIGNKGREWVRGSGKGKTANGVVEVVIGEVNGRAAGKG